MQTCFFAISGVLPRDEAIAEIKAPIKKTYGKRGETVLQQNYAGVDTAIAELHRGEGPGIDRRRPAPAAAGACLRARLRQAGHGDDDRGQGRPAARQRHAGRRHVPDRHRAVREAEHRAVEIPIWDPDICIQCGLCSLVCPHAAIRSKVFPTSALENRPGRLPVGALRARNIPAFT